MSKSSRYREAGVDIDAKYDAVARAKDAIRTTFTPGVVSDIGSFGGLFDPARVDAAGEILVASADGVGTKVKVAAMAGRYDTVGQCLVNHCVNDILVQGARPLFFLDYIGCGKMQPVQVGKVLEGLATACRENGFALLGGETAEMPGMYEGGDFEVVGTIVGSVAREGPARWFAGATGRQDPQPAELGAPHQWLQPGAQGALRRAGSPGR
jgi:phosphoribosylformylglycinamidine cyclo-ligase